MKRTFPRTGVIYRIHCNITQEDYYGSTLSSLTERMHKHTADNNTCRSRHIIKRGNYTVETLELLTVYSEQELRDLEAKYIKNNKCINRNLPRQSLYCDKCQCRIRDVETHERSLKHINKDTRTKQELFKEIEEKMASLTLKTLDKGVEHINDIFDKIIELN